MSFPVVVAESAEAALEVEGKPAGQLGVGVVFPLYGERAASLGGRSRSMLEKLM
jgi:hypothetical protein